MPTTRNLLSAMRGLMGLVGCSTDRPKPCVPCSDLSGRHEGNADFAGIGGDARLSNAMVRAMRCTIKVEHRNPEVKA